MPKQQTVDSYIKGFNPQVQAVLNKIRSIIKSVAPKSSESITYGIPTYKIEGQRFIYFAAFKKHISLYPMTDAIKKKFKSEIKGLKTSTGTIQFPLNKPIPYSLIKRMSQFRMKEVSSKIKTWK